MPGYISSFNNRLYVSSEQQYGVVPTFSSANRFPGIRLSVNQRSDRIERRDKTGTRTFVGFPGEVRKRTSFELRTYMTAWADQSTEPCYGPFFRSALGGNATLFGGGTVAAFNPPADLTFTAAHGLSEGQAVAFGSEIRFAQAILSQQSVQLNAPFGIVPSAGSPLSKTMTYRPATELPSFSILDCWTPTSAVQRVIAGCAIDSFRVRVNSDLHDFEFSGICADILDSATFTAGEGGMAQFPAEPQLGEWNHSIVPGHLGQAWFGPAPTQFLTLTGAQIRLDNNVEPRATEYGFSTPRYVTPGPRRVTVDMSLFQQDDVSSAALYQSARQRSPISVMLQLGQQPGQLCGICLKSVVPELPDFDDTESRVQWRFGGCRAQGGGDDEIVVGFA